jgi:hypothetical protein
MRTDILESLKFRMFPTRLFCAFALVTSALSSVSCGAPPEAPSANELQSIPPSKLSTLSFIDSINGVTNLAHDRVVIPRGDTVTVTGWAVDSAAKQPASRVYLDLDGRTYPTQYGIVREDVTSVFKEPAYLHSGFTGTLTSVLGDKDHHLSLKIVNAGNSAYYTGAGVTFALR